MSAETKQSEIRERQIPSPLMSCGGATLFAALPKSAGNGNSSEQTPPRHTTDTASPRGRRAKRAAQRSILPGFLNALALRRQDIPGASDGVYGVPNTSERLGYQIRQSH